MFYDLKAMLLLLIDFRRSHENIIFASSEINLKHKILFHRKQSTLGLWSVKSLKHI